MNKLKVALAHDYLTQFGGAEQVLRVLCEIFPEAPIYTLIYDEQRTHYVFKNKKIITSFIQNLPFSKRHHRFYPWLMPMAIEQFDFSKYDLVLSDSASFAKGIITRPETLHICYCHTPLRYIWTDAQRAKNDYKNLFFAPKIIPYFQHYLRLWDFAAAQRVDYFIANSQNVAKRIKKYYRRKAEIIYPPIRVKQMQQTLKKINSRPIKEKYFLVVSRLLPYKSVDIAIKAFSNLPQEKLIIIGGGTEFANLKKIASKNIHFVGEMPFEKIIPYYAFAEALIFPQEEDFGMAAVEALACGVPVIGFNGGGIKEIVRNEESGILFEEQSPAALLEALKKFEKIKNRFNKDYLKKEAQKFDQSIFKEKIIKYITQLIS
jgi:glycosyltransferase involved in cell wall biosynthesis